MPDLLSVFQKGWKMIAGLTLLTTLVALITALLSPKEYLSTATALPANSVTADKARIFNPHIQHLYSEFGSVDELDKIEGTAALDTLYIAAITDLNLKSYYTSKESRATLDKLIKKLKSQTSIRRSEYGELKIKAWDKDPAMAAAIANNLLDQIQSIYQNLQVNKNKLLLNKISDDYLQKMAEYSNMKDSASISNADLLSARKNTLLNQMQQYAQLIDHYKISVSASTPVLFEVERARPSAEHDRPKVFQIVIFSLFASFVFSFLMALILSARKDGM